MWWKNIFKTENKAVEAVRAGLLALRRSSVRETALALSTVQSTVSKLTQANRLCKRIIHENFCFHE
jgi:hypothetical protein